MSGKRLGFYIEEIKEIIKMYSEIKGEKGKIKMMMKRVEEKREDLRKKRRDIDEKIGEIDKVEEEWIESMEGIGV